MLQDANCEFKSTHNKLCIPIVNRLYLKMLVGIKFPPIKVDGDLIIDGHHRYLASLLANFNLDRVPSKKTSATVVTTWTEIEFENEDWDTEADIKMFNEIDAKYNDISPEKIVELLAK